MSALPGLDPTRLGLPTRLGEYCPGWAGKSWPGPAFIFINFTVFVLYLPVCTCCPMGLDCPTGDTQWYFHEYSMYNVSGGLYSIYLCVHVALRCRIVLPEIHRGTARSVLSGWAVQYLPVCTCSTTLPDCPAGETQWYCPECTLWADSTSRLLLYSSAPVTSSLLKRKRNYQLTAEMGQVTNIFL